MSTGLFDDLQNSGSTQAIARTAWPPQLAKIRNITELYGYVHDPRPVSSDGTTMANVVGGLEAIRDGEPGSVRFKAYRFYIAIRKDGKPYWTGPFKDTPHPHHADELPPWATKG